MALSKIDTAGIGDNAITSDKILSGAVSAADIEDSTITAAKLYSTLDLSGKTITMPSNSIGSGNISDGAITDGKLASTLDLSGKTVTYGLSGSDLPTGSILQVVQTVKTDTYSMSSTTWTDVTGLSLSITPTSTSSKILVFYNLSISTNAGAYSGMIKLVRDTTDIFLGDADGSKTRASSGGYSDYYGYQMRAEGNMYLDSPSTTSSTTYKIQIVSGYSGYAVYVGRGYTESDNTPYARLPSTITAMEIAG